MNQLQVHTKRFLAVLVICCVVIYACYLRVSVVFRRSVTLQDGDTILQTYVALKPQETDIQPKFISRKFAFETNDAYFTRERTINTVDCIKLKLMDVKQHTLSNSIISLYGDGNHNSCDELTLGFITSSLTELEESFPIAYSVLMYKDVAQVWTLLQAIYRPQNLYCIHIDSRSPASVWVAMRNIVRCFGNVFLSSRSVYHRKWMQGKRIINQIEDCSYVKKTKQVLMTLRPGVNNLAKSLRCKLQRTSSNRTPLFAPKVSGLEMFHCKSDMVMTNDLMAKYNLKGNKGKLAFEKTALYQVIQVAVDWGKFTNLEPEIVCMQDMWNKGTKWRYFINLTGQEFPLKTNYELVQILTAYDGANDVEGIITGQNPDRWAHAGDPPDNLLPVKGAVHVILGRKFVEYVLTENISKRVLDWSKKIEHPDEVFFNTLNFNPKLKIPGAFGSENVSLIETKPFLARYKVWKSTRDHRQNCTGMSLRNICILDIGDLKNLTKSNALFANKFLWQHGSKVAEYCMTEYIYNRTKADYFGNITFNAAFYLNLSFVKHRIK